MIDFMENFWSLPNDQAFGKILPAISQMIYGQPQALQEGYCQTDNQQIH